MSTFSKIFSTPKHAPVHPEKNYTHLRLGDDTRNRLKNAEKIQKESNMYRVPAAAKSPNKIVFNRSKIALKPHALYNMHFNDPIRKSSIRKKSPSKGGKSRRRRHRKTVKKGYFW